MTTILLVLEDMREVDALFSMPKSKSHSQIDDNVSNETSGQAALHHQG